MFDIGCSVLQQSILQPTSSLTPTQNMQWLRHSWERCKDIVCICRTSSNIPTSRETCFLPLYYAQFRWYTCTWSICRFMHYFPELWCDLTLSSSILQVTSHRRSGKWSQKLPRETKHFLPFMTAEDAKCKYGQHNFTRQIREEETATPWRTTNGKARKPWDGSGS